MIQNSDAYYDKLPELIMALFLSSDCKGGCSSVIQKKSMRGYVYNNVYLNGYQQ